MRFHSSLALAVSVTAVLACGGVETSSSSSQRSTPAATSSAPSAPSSAPQRARAGAGADKQWAKQVLLGTEFGGDGALTARYTHDITVSAFSAEYPQRKLLKEVVGELDPLIAPLNMELIHDEHSEADMKVYFVPIAEFDGIGKQNGFPVVAGNHGFFWTFWDGNHALTKTHVLIAEDLLQGDQLRHYLFEEVTQALGLSSDSPVFEDSVFFSDGNRHGDVTTLSERDKKLVRFAYKVPPKSTEATVDRLFDQHWGR